MELLLESIKAIHPLSTKTLAALQKELQKDELPKKHQLLIPGQACNKLWFLEKGMVRKYMIVNGRESTAWIHWEGAFFTSLDAFLNQVPTSEFLEVYEDAVLYSLTLDAIKRLSVFEDYNIFSKKLTDSAVVKLNESSLLFKHMSTKEKYLHLCQHTPELTQRAQLSHIASIIGVSLETLSRIRAKL